MQVAAAVLEAFPPRGSIALLPLDQTQGGKTAMERLIMEQYILDTIHYFDGDRVQCARKLALGGKSASCCSGIASCSGIAFLSQSPVLHSSVGFSEGESGCSIHVLHRCGVSQSQRQCVGLFADACHWSSLLMQTEGRRDVESG